MKPINMSTLRLRHLLQQVAEREDVYRICCARDILGPGGGVYIAEDPELNERHLNWLERRNPAPSGETTYLEVVIYKGKRAVSPARDELEIGEEEGSAPQDLRARAEQHSREVIEHAEQVGEQAEAIFRAVGKVDFTAADLRRGEAAAGLRELESRFKVFHGVVKKSGGRIFERQCISHGIDPQIRPR